jgi:L-threonylcarbamoyladenylate synthase
LQRGTDITLAARVLREGGLVAFPTETVYGLGADASSPAAVRKIFAVKGRPPGHPLIVHLAPGTDLDGYAAGVPAAARALAARFWPGPLTMILRRGPKIAPEVTGGGATVGLRMPQHPLAQQLLAAFGGAVAAPSANRFGRISATTADHVAAELGDDIDYLLDGGACEVGVESTIVDLSGGPGALPVLLRPGGLGRDELERALGVRVADAGADAPRAPGTLPSHYAPRARVVAVPLAEVPAAVAAAAARGTVAVLSLPDDLDEAARRLYASLRELDATGVDVIVAALPPEVGIGAAIADRLRRAAGPRDPTPEPDHA